jgi:hypothetical protein
VDIFKCIFEDRESLDISAAWTRDKQNAEGSGKARRHASAAVWLCGQHARSWGECSSERKIPYAATLNGELDVQAIATTRLGA